jgi:hypothetical protein
MTPQADAAGSAYALAEPAARGRAGRPAGQSCDELQPTEPI